MVIYSIYFAFLYITVEHINYRFFVSRVALYELLSAVNESVQGNEITDRDIVKIILLKCLQ